MNDFDKIMMEYEKLRYEAVRKKNEKVNSFYKQYPELLEVMDMINDCGVINTGMIIANPEKGDEIIDKMEKKINDLKQKKHDILKKYNIPEDFERVVYNCSLCNDTGFIGSEKCECFKRKLTEAAYERSNIKNLLKTQNFENFKFDFYSQEKNSLGISPAEYAKKAYDEAKRFCDNFSESKNLLFYGNTGLGKTFISSCIAKQMMDMGKTVCYISATKMFSVYDDYKFNRGNTEENKRVVDEIYNSDLLIIDDLGTEFLTTNSLSFMFDILNERIVTDKKLVISTNLSIDEMNTRYTPRFISRLYESFKTLKLEGENIRKRL